MPERITYSATPEHKLEGAWRECPPAHAKRWAVYRTTWFTGKRGQSRPKPKRRLLATFFGPDAEACATRLVAHSTSLTRRRPTPPARTEISRSLSKQQWLEAQKEQ